ncbi:ecdysone oxidase-like [Haemaphysalis longicornis]
MPYHPNLLLSVLNYVSIVILFVETPLDQSFYSQPSGDGTDEYDYIIVGAGSAGCVLANRLSKDPNMRVLLLEAGGPEEAAAQVPFFTTLLQFTHMDWGYHSEPQKNASYALFQRINTLPRGKTLGGTSSLNFMVYSRGNPEDYNSWESEYGAQNWSYRHVKEDFKAIEKSYLNMEPDYHGTSGEVPVTFANDTTEASKVFLEAGQELGYNINCDYNGRNQTCFSRLQRNGKDGERWSSSRSFITKEVRCRTNLHISLHSHVTKIIIEKKVAVGVNYTRHNKTYTAKAKREVILSAGAFGSAQLLMLSGIGPRDHLETLKIPVEENLPVGTKMYDHVLVYGLLGIKNKEEITDPSLLQTLSEYGLFRKGSLIYPSGADSVAFINTENSDPRFPDIQFLMVSEYPKPIELPKMYPYCRKGLTPEQCPTIYHVWLRSYFMSVAPILLRPKASGFIKLKSANPFDHPIIDPQLLSHEADMETMVKGVTTAVCLLKTDSMAAANVKLFDEPLEHCKNYTMWSDKYIRCLVRFNSHSGWHPCCTAPMGNHSDAVLDSRLRSRCCSRSHG